MAAESVPTDSGRVDTNPIRDYVRFWAHPLEPDVKGPNAERVLSFVDEAGLVRLAQSFVQIDTQNPPGNEGALAASAAEYLGRWGLACEIQEVKPGRNNLLARLGSEGAHPHLIFNGHTDTVPAGGGWTHDPCGGEIAGGRLYGRGASDMKGGLAAMIMAVEAIVRSGADFTGCLTLAAMMDEEETQDGTRFAVSHGLRGDFAIVGEPTDLRPVIAHKGDAVIEIETRGVEAHGSTPDAGVSAIDHMADVLIELRALSERMRARRDPVVGHPTLHVGTIEGGVNPWMVAGRCRITIDRRVLPGERAEDVVQEVQEVVDRLDKRVPNFRGAVRLATFARPMKTASDNPVVTAVREATATVLGRDPGVHGWSATCDANIHVNDGDTPAIVFGPGSIEREAHRPDESVAISELVEAAKIYALTALRLLQGAG
jgi:acetylornithine deacetylase/succinyl-diaminopimelate desuccinylase family protein